MRRQLPSLRHDPKADAVYITLSEKPYAFGEDLGPERRVDYAADGSPVGVELLAVSRGVDVSDLPHRDEITLMLGQAGLPVLTAK